MTQSTDIAALVAALTAQTAAIDRLAESNRQVIDYLLSQDADVVDYQDIDALPSRHLDPSDD